MAAGLLAVVMAVPSCGGGGGAGPTGSTPGTPSTTIPAVPSAATFTITSAGVSPKQAEIPVGGRVTFINNDQAFHEMASDPHPIHTDCPAMNEVGSLSPGLSRQSGPFPTARSCGFHDHGQSSNTSLQGTIIVR